MADSAVKSQQPSGPLELLEDWDDDLKRRYPETGRDLNSFRNYAQALCLARASGNSYRLNHRYRDNIGICVREKAAGSISAAPQANGYLGRYGVPNTLVDYSVNPDIDLNQIEHFGASGRGHASRRQATLVHFDGP